MLRDGEAFLSETLRFPNWGNNDVTHNHFPVIKMKLFLCKSVEIRSCFGEDFDALKELQL